VTVDGSYRKCHPSGVPPRNRRRPSAQQLALDSVRSLKFDRENIVELAGDRFPRILTATIGGDDWPCLLELVVYVLDSGELIVQGATALDPAVGLLAALRAARLEAMLPVWTEAVWIAYAELRAEGYREKIISIRDSAFATPEERLRNGRLADHIESTFAPGAVAATLAAPVKGRKQYRLTSADYEELVGVYNANTGGTPTKAVHDYFAAKYPKGGAPADRTLARHIARAKKAKLIRKDAP